MENDKWLCPVFEDEGLTNLPGSYRNYEISERDEVEYLEQDLSDGMVINERDTWNVYPDGATVS